jgi:hypothetical protein
MAGYSSDYCWCIRGSLFFLEEIDSLSTLDMIITHESVMSTQVRKVRNTTYHLAAQMTILSEALRSFTSMYCYYFVSFRQQKIFPTFSLSSYS